MVENDSHLSCIMIRLATLAVLLLFPLTSFAAEELNLYSARHYDTDFSLYDRFTEETGVKVNLIEGGSDALIERILAEGELSPADILITVDAGRLWRAAEAGVFQSIDSPTLNSRVPEHLRDSDNLWFGLSKRARVIVYRKSEGFVKPTQYEDLANPAYRNRVCMRSSSNIYNLSLLAGMIETAGNEAAMQWAQGVVGHVAMTGDLVNIADASSDGRWAPETDRNTGYQTGAMLCTPIRDANGNLLGVVQVLNKDRVTLDERDEV